ncbi:MAG: flagellar hook protein FlgE [Deltaproteobacteria bacterium]|nr:MAG: flagellar hook protein FlgE [Deltaproteobacteria bacterium]HEX15556.1 flagellar hook protein FlgE [Deltaproteobacteria bacterium]
MGLSSSLFSAVSGLRGYGIAMSVTGDNIANVNTLGFKASRITFEDALSQLVATAAGSSQVGRGVAVSDISMIFAQGSFETTSEPTDLAIGGKGFFILRDPNNLKTYYTRAGQFRFDADGRLVNPEGYIVQGWRVQRNASGGVDIVGSITDIVISSTSSDPRPTAEVQIAVNLDASAETPSVAFDINDSSTWLDASNYHTSITVYDSFGQGHAVTVYFRYIGTDASGNRQWQWWATVQGSDTASGRDEACATGVLTFNPDGVLVSESPSGGEDPENPGNPPDFDFSGGAAPDQVINFYFGLQPGAVSKTTQFASPFATIYQTQDGYSSGFLQTVSVDTDGVIYGHYTNGQIMPLFRIALANFANPWGLLKEGGNLYSESNRTGEVVTGPPGTAGLGRIAPNSLEQSNVDLANEFIKMIIFQRAFQANSRVVTTTDDMMAELINIKR